MKKRLVLGRTGFVNREGGGVRWGSLPLAVYFLLLLGDLWPSSLLPSQRQAKFKHGTQDPLLRFHNEL